jgi:hypothetical protein
VEEGKRNQGYPHEDGNEHEDSLQDVLPHLFSQNKWRGDSIPAAPPEELCSVNKFFNPLAPEEGSPWGAIFFANPSFLQIGLGVEIGKF